MAAVCSECAEPLVQAGRYLFGPILDGLMAHEISRLLLAHEQKLFTAKQAERIRAQVRDRMRNRRATPMAQAGESR